LRSKRKPFNDGDRKAAIEPWKANVPHKATPAQHAKTTLKRILIFSGANLAVDKLPAEAGGLHAQEVGQGHLEEWVDYSLLICIDIC
jgi:hypothetical protein